jgi:hypothetical protein
VSCKTAHVIRLEPGLAGQAPLGSLWQEQTGGSRAKAKSKDKVLEMHCQGIQANVPDIPAAMAEGYQYM